MKLREVGPGLRWASGRPWLRHVVFLTAGVTVMGLDQLTKLFVRQGLAVGEAWPADWPVRFQHVTNTGAAFGILQGQSGFLILTTVVGVAAILLYYRFLPMGHALLPACLGAILGGTLGNLTDRLRLGHVTDFIDFPRYPAFNLADSSIVVAIVVILGLTALVGTRQGDESRR